MKEGTGGTYYVESHGSNNDGCDPEYCKNVVIKNCTFNTGDDCIAIKSGRNGDGRRVAIKSEKGEVTPLMVESIISQNLKNEHLGNRWKKEEETKSRSGNQCTWEEKNEMF